MPDGSARRGEPTAHRTGQDGPVPGWSWREARQTLRLGKKEGASAVILQWNGDARFNFMGGACNPPQQNKGGAHEASSKATMDARFASAQSGEMRPSERRTSRQRRSADRLAKYIRSWKEHQPEACAAAAEFATAAVGMQTERASERKENQRADANDRLQNDGAEAGTTEADPAQQLYACWKQEVLTGTPVSKSVPSPKRARETAAQKGGHTSPPPPSPSRRQRADASADAVMADSGTAQPQGAAAIQVASRPAPRAARPAAGGAVVETKTVHAATPKPLQDPGFVSNPDEFRTLRDEYCRRKAAAIEEWRVTIGRPRWNGDPPPEVGLKHGWALEWAFECRRRSDHPWYKP